MLKRYLPKFIIVILFYICDIFCNLSKRFEYRKSNIYLPLNSKVDRNVIFKQDQIELLLKFKWLANHDVWLRENAGFFENIVEFIKTTRNIEA
jgi:hypothetical protein